MSLVINNNMMAANTARTLNGHYGRLAQSTQRLSSGLRINSAADDAAGLAIRELQRAEIAALQQGARNANDAVSLIQTADGGLSIIDEKLTRMKELAEQAATGTYDSTQRLMIESEYQAMASEITRIANATDFNGIYLLNGNLSSSEHDGSGLTSTGKLKVHFGSSNMSAEDYYYITIGDCRAEALGIGNASTWEEAQKRIVSSFASNLLTGINNIQATTDDEKRDKQDVLNGYANIVADFNTQLNDITHPTSNEAFLDAMAMIPGDIGYTLPAGTNGAALTFDEYKALSERDKQKLHYAWGQAAMQQYATTQGHQHGFDGGNHATVGVLSDISGLARQGTVDATVLRSAALAAAHAETKHYDYAGYTVQTQEDAQLALTAINNAIVEKDKIRAHLGAMQNRLENTIANLNIQAENLQAAESRISDVDVATEMTEFVRNQILTQSAVAMLSQANSLPQMAMQLIGG